MGVGGGGACAAGSCGRYGRVLFKMTLMPFIEGLPRLFDAFFFLLASECGAFMPKGSSQRHHFVRRNGAKHHVYETIRTKPLGL